ncbi:MULTISPECIES: hypothetical protein [unclassified Pseudomonas]|uniref:hypothetical protein n=1 Tax=unclassified Pseudomonas TaxID=196821 RepID=UPI000F56278C|nr:MULTISPECIES: hypothetical protein [unclassified Pseudomonas]AZF48229.1 hypothetical protein C4J86_2996 [Pseudomonas sp. R2-7-07]AZF58737.1 hypothetical protein C4J84_2862 [Pseudomonas sp. R11-23-07]
MTDHTPADKTPAPISSEDAQKGHADGAKGQTLERPNPKTETIDKVVTPTSIKDLERQTDAINEKLSKGQ